MHPSTNEACEVYAALEALARATPVRAVVDAADAYADCDGNVTATARAVGLARSTVRARLARMTREARALELRPLEGANDNCDAREVKAATRRRRIGPGVVDCDGSGLRGPGSSDPGHPRSRAPEASRELRPARRAPDLRIGARRSRLATLPNLNA